MGPGQSKPVVLTSDTEQAEKKKGILRSKRLEIKQDDVGMKTRGEKKEEKREEKGKSGE